MRLLTAIIAAGAYVTGRQPPAAYCDGLDPIGALAAPGAGSEPPIVEPWRPVAMTCEPDPVAAFMADALRAKAGAQTSALVVLDAYRKWADIRGLRAAEGAAVLTRLRHYATVQDVPGRGLCLIGVEAHAWAIASADDPRGRSLHLNRPTPLRAIPGLRARVLADAALLSAELLAVLQSTRDVLEAATDEPGTVGDIVRMAAAMLDDVLCDAATPPTL